jgi:acetyl esterase/lipase
MSPCKTKLLALLVLGMIPATPNAGAQPGGTRLLTVQDVLKLPVPAADHRLAYGGDPLQFGDLRLPQGAGPHPVVIVLHGGAWLAQYNLDHVASFCAALTRAGVATWSLEYRRVGNPGGGWPGTFTDVARGADHLRILAGPHRLDLDRVAVVGHSAGGHLALWLAGRRRLPKGSPLYADTPLPVRGVVSLAGVTDLRKFRLRMDVVDQLLGGKPDDVPGRYEQTSPLELLPLGVPQWLLHGARDGLVPIALAKEYEAAAKKKGDDVRLTLFEAAGHFELIVPESSAWPAVRDAVLSVLKRERSK